MSKDVVGAGQLPAETMRTCVLAATAAPSVHNTQPWLFRLRPAAVEVFVDRHRQLNSVDPDGREMYVSVGAAVFNLKLALRAFGWAADLELMPGRSEPDLAARIVVSGPADVPESVSVLAHAIPRRHTNRRPFSDQQLPDGVVRELVAAATAEGASMMVADPALCQGVLGLTRTAERRLREDPYYELELKRWTTAGGPGRRDGVPRQALGPRDTDAALPLRDFTIGHGMPTSSVTFERNPTIALLTTSDDRRVDWLRTGLALQRVLLTATVRGLAATPLSQLTEVAALRDLLADRSSGSLVQSVLRLGYPAHPAVATPRRDLNDVIITARSNNA
jgi:hypothetical protein